MKKQAVNPYLPGNEYVPDGEPYVFGDRIYVYGSHDRFGAKFFCMNDYVCWSAPIDDRGQWRYEGVIYQKKQDPMNRWRKKLLFAPDMVQGPDGRFYLFYGLEFVGIMGVAVCDSPCGKFEFYGHIRHADHELWGRKAGDSFPFDPAILVDDDQRIYLYSGFYTPIPAFMTGGVKLRFEGGYVLELESDMRTIKTREKLLFPKQGQGSFRGHEFFEASSIRKYDSRYYFTYSSRVNHELCYAVSDYPTHGFVYKSVLISNGDIGLPAYPHEKKAANYTGNNHGGMLRLGEDMYIFYHRHTNRSSYARQTCAQVLKRDEKGDFIQAEMTSCGLNAGPLRGNGIYEARIACNLWSLEGTGRYDLWGARWLYHRHPYITQEGKDKDPNAFQYIANMRHGSVAGFKYFRMQGTDYIKIRCRGRAKGALRIYTDVEFSEPCAVLAIDVNKDHWQIVQGKVMKQKGVKPLFIEYVGQGAVDIKDFYLGKRKQMAKDKEKK